MSDKDQPVQARLQQCADTGNLDGMALEYWVGGGPPPPYYRSDQLRLIDGANGPKWFFSRPYVDDAFDAPDLVETFERRASGDEIRKMAGLLAKSGVFSAPAVESKTGTDALSTEIIVPIGGANHMRKFPGRVPEALQTLDAEMHVLRMDLELNGTRTVTHSGKPVVPAPRRQK